MLVLGRHHHAQAVLGVGSGLVLAVLLAAVPATAADRAPEPMLSIAVDNGGTSADAGDTLDYTITVENIGADAVRDLRVTQTMPAGLTFESADRGGAERPGMVVWSVDLAAGATRALQATMTVGSTPDEVLRLASVACASVTAKQGPLVCATHSDELPAGSDAREREAASASGAADASSTWTDGVGPWIGLAGVCLGLGLVVLRRRSRVGA